MSRSSPLWRRLALTIAAAAIAGVAQASPITYTDLASFQSASGATLTENFNHSAIKYLATPGSPGVNASFGDFTLTGSGNGDYVAIAPGTRAGNTNGSTFLYWSEEDLVGGMGGNGGAGPSLTFTFATAISSFGFDWNDTDPTDSWMVTIDGHSYSNPPFLLSGTGGGFWGVAVSGAEAFTSVTFTQNVAAGYIDPFGVDNIYTSPAPVPEPGTLLLLGTGIAAAVRRYRRRRV
jgi:hypothetical protein